MRGHRLSAVPRAGLTLSGLAPMKRIWFARFLELPNGIPSHDTFGRMFAHLDTAEFYACLQRSVPAWARCPWTTIPTRSPWVRKLLEMLELIGAVVTLVAMHCKKETAQTIRDKGDDHLHGFPRAGSVRQGFA